MKKRLPVYIENRELPNDQFNVNREKVNSYGYVNVLYLSSIIITIISVVTVIIVRYR